MPDIKPELFEICRRFIADQDITCPEAIYQTDRVLENAPEFIEEICLLIGYAVPNGERG